MPSLNELLRELHRLHLKVHELREETEQAPRRLRTTQARVELRQRELQSHLDSVKQSKVAILSKEASIKDQNQLVAKYQSQMATVSTKKEYDALRHEIDNCKQACRVIEDEILGVMLTIDEKNAQTPELEKALQQAQDEYRKAEAGVKGRQADLTQGLVEAEQLLKSTENELTGDLRKLYDRLIAAHGIEALAQVNGRSCAGCYTELTSQQMNDLRADRLVTCKSCARLLYTPEQGS